MINMKVLENITSGYKKIATGIAIVSVLALMYIALIPGGTLAAVTAQGVGIGGAIVKVVEWPEFNATTAPDGTYTINGVPYNDTPQGSTYTLRASAAGYGSNSSIVTLTPGNPNPAVNWELYPSDPRYVTYLDDRGTTYESQIQIFNPYNFTTTADVTAWNILNGGLNNTTAFETPVNSLGSIFMDQIAGGNFIGTTKVENTRPQSIVQGYIRTLSTGIYSIAPSRKVSTSNVQYIPYLDDRGTAYDSGIQVFNPYDVTITANLTAYNLLNGQNTTLSFDIPAKFFGSRYAGDVAGGAVGSNVDFIGTVKVETSQPALVQGNLRTLSTMTSSIAPGIVIPTSNVQYIPYLDDRGTIYDSGIQVFNPYDVTITANLTAYNLLNGQITTLNFDIPAKSFGSRYAGDVAGGAVGSNVDFIGTVKAETSQPALVQGNLRTRTTMTTSIASATLMPTVNVQYIPFLNDTGITYDSGIQIFNPYDVTITASLTAYNLLNSQITTLNFDIPAKSFGSRYAGDVAGGAVGSNVDFVGSIKVETSQPVPAQGNLRARLASMTNSVAPAVVLE